MRAHAWAALLPLCDGYGCGRWQSVDDGDGDDGDGDNGDNDDGDGNDGGCCSGYDDVFRVLNITKLKFQLQI